MQTRIIEATNGDPDHGAYANWGKFCVARMDTEWARRSVPCPTGGPLLSAIGWTLDHLWVLDLQTGEGAFFKPGGYAPADLQKHKVWVCPLFEPFLVWLYEQDLSDLATLPDHVQLPNAEFSMVGYRRPGPDTAR